jgi:hypothetical protein
MSSILLKRLSLLSLILALGSAGWLFLNYGRGETGDSHESGVAKLKAALNAGHSTAAEGPKFATLTPTFPKRTTMWDAKTDAVDKKVTLSIPLEDQTKELVGIIQMGCEWSSAPAIFLRIGISRKLNLFNKVGNQQVAMFTAGYKIGTNSYAKVTQAKDYNFIKFFGASSNVSLTDPSEYGVEEAHNIAEMVRRIHRSNLAFELASDLDDRFRSWISVEAPSPILDSHTKLFESVSAYCIDLVK